MLTLAPGTEQPANPMPPVVPASTATMATSPPYGATFWDQWVRHFVARDASFNLLSLDPQNPGKWQERIVQLTAVQDTNTTDLSAFAKKGGKVLMAHGSHDALVGPRATQQYWSRINAAMGTEKVATFALYYKVPGYGHAVSSVFNAA
jgi:Tannase and feruloyl esterase